MRPVGTAKKKRSNLGIWLGIVAGALVAAVGVLRIVVLEGYKHPSGSMLPTIPVGEYLLVNKLATEPSRGSVIVFEYPDSPDQKFVKRIIGMPGDRLEVVAGRPIVNGKPVPECKVGKLTGSGAPPGTVFVERVGDVSFLVVRETVAAGPCQRDDDCARGEVCRASSCGLLQGPWKVPAGEVWVLGDNRDNSHDSRSWNAGRGRGVPLGAIVGSVLNATDAQLPKGADATFREGLAKCRASVGGAPG